jgi:hypothetical protein
MHIPVVLSCVSMEVLLKRLVIWYDIASPLGSRSEIDQPNTLRV